MTSREDFCKIACGVIDDLGIAADTLAMCGECDAAIAAACEAALGGPLDPFADACAASMPWAFQFACGEVIAQGDTFDTAACEKELC